MDKIVTYVCCCSRRGNTGHKRRQDKAELVQTKRQAGIGRQTRLSKINRQKVQRNTQERSPREHEELAGNESKEQQLKSPK